MGHFCADSYHHGGQQDAEHFFSFDDALKIAFDVSGPTLTVDAYTNLTNATDIAEEKQVAQFLGGLTDPNSDPHRFDNVDGTDHFTLTVNTATGVADLTFQESSERQFDHKAAEPFPTQELLGILSGGDPTNPEYYGYDNALKLAVGTGQNGSGLKVDAYTNYTNPADIALEKQVVNFAGALIDPAADPHRFDNVDGTDHFTFTVDPSGTANLTFQPVTTADFTAIQAEPFPINDILALLTGQTPSSNDGSYGDTSASSGQHDTYGWHSAEVNLWDHVKPDHSPDMVLS